MSGILYGIGTGPGDPELMTLKAIKVIKSCEIIAIPISNKTLEKPVLIQHIKEQKERLLKECVAYQIAIQNIPEMKDKPILYLPMPMTKEKNRLKEKHNQDIAKIIELLKEGKRIGFLTLGDPTVFSTYLSLHQSVLQQGYLAEMISGVPSFCAVAAQLNIGLSQNKEAIHVIPACYGVEETLALPGTKILMKIGKEMKSVKQAIKQSGQSIWMMENCGMEKQKSYSQLEAIPDLASYYSIIVVKEK